MAPKSKNAAGASAKTRQRPNSDFLDLDCVSEPEFAEGKVRQYLLTEIPNVITQKRSVTSKEAVCVALLVVVSLFVRFGLALPKLVVFDEVHFGGFARKYILGTYFMDVHPPLSKMLFAAVGVLGGFKGDFEFTNIGDDYPELVPYELMRMFPAVLGVATVVLCYLTLRASGVRPAVALATAACLLFENSFITISRYILLDAPLVFFVAAAVYSFKKFEVQQPFLFGWWRLLVLCGVALGLALLSKWVGLFTVAWVGILCVFHMWFLIGDLSVPMPVVMKHGAARAAVLLGVLVALYLALFAIHFSVLSKTGDGASFLSSAFRATFEGLGVPMATNAQVGYGSVVTIRHINTQGGYLHSHAHFYPAGSKQQQITLYPHLDVNNDWEIEPYNFTTPENFTQLKDGDKIRLRHVVTHRHLHSHDEKPPVSERDWQKECSGYGYEGFAGDANDDWIVEVVKHKTPLEAQTNITAIKTVFRLRHAMTGMYLFSSEVKLPEWGFDQQEVTAAAHGARRLTEWYIETNNNKRLSKEEAKTVEYPKYSFWDKFVESHKVMWRINQGLTGHHVWQSSPHEWPILNRGINYWGKDHTQVYLIGNPVVWWTASAVVAAFFIHVAISVVRWQAGASVASSKNVFNFNAQMFSYVFGWAIHYLPFFIMGRQLFLHHYLPAQYFAILALGHVFELLVASFSRNNRPALGAVALFVVATLVFYNSLAPLISGGQWTKDQCKKSMLKKSWGFHCDGFFDKKSEYLYYTPSSLSPSLTSLVETSKKTAEPVKQEVKGEGIQSPVHVPEEPPKPETHAGELPEHLKDEEAPHAEQEDVGTPEKVQEVSEQVDTADEVVEHIPVEAVAEPASEPEVEPETVEPQEEAAQPEQVEQVEQPQQEEPVDPGYNAPQVVMDAPEEPVKAEEVHEPVVEHAEQVQQVMEQAQAEVHQAAEEQIVEPVQEIKESVEHVAEPVVEQAAEAVEQVVEQVAESVEQVAEPVVEQVVEPVEQIVEPVVEQVAEPVEQVAEPIIEQVHDAAAEAV